MTVRLGEGFLPNSLTLFLVKAVNSLKLKSGHSLLFVVLHFKRVLVLLYHLLIEKAHLLVLLLQDRFFLVTIHQSIAKQNKAKRRNRLVNRVFCWREIDIVCVRFYLFHANLKITINLFLYLVEFMFTALLSWLLGCFVFSLSWHRRATT